MNVHFISIGGSVMHQLAIALHRNGYYVTGSDDEIFEPSRTNLYNEGLLPQAPGWDENRLHPGLDAVILGMHARADNPELVKAQQLGLPVYSFPEYIYRESLQKTRVVVGGSHGKTTTTSMIMHVLRHAAQRFDYLVGARLEGFDQSVSITDAPVIVCEGDEYPASAVERRPKFHFLHPHIAIITGIAWDHINVFPTFDNYLEQFRIFIEKIEPGGVLIYNTTDDVLVTLVEESKRGDIEYVPYGVPVHTIANGKTTVMVGGAEGSLRVFGNHNLLNMHATWLACSRLGVSAEQFVSAMHSFTGAARRLELVAEGPENTIYRDFAHAPSKVKATMEAVKQQFPERRLVAVLELHTYSSLNADFMPQYAGSLDAAHEACVFYSRHAMEIKRMPELPAEVVREGFGKPNLFITTNRLDLEQWLQSRNYDHANLLLMSSGTFEGLDMGKLANTVLDKK